MEKKKKTPSVPTGFNDPDMAPDDRDVVAPVASDASRHHLVPSFVRMSVLQAVKELRVKLGDTQQQFAHRLGLAISTVVRYETTRPPRGKALAQLEAVAAANSLHYLSGVFRSELTKELGTLESVAEWEKRVRLANAERLARLLTVLQNENVPPQRRIEHAIGRLSSIVDVMSETEGLPVLAAEGDDSRREEILLLEKK